MTTPYNEKLKNDKAFRPEKNAFETIKNLRNLYEARDETAFVEAGGGAANPSLIFATCAGSTFQRQWYMLNLPEAGSTE